jgi:hypothetical protein
LFNAQPMRAAAPDLRTLQGKKVLYIQNFHEVEEVKARVPPATPARIQRQEAVLADDKLVVEHLKKLGLVVTLGDETSSVDLVKDADLLIVAESVTANAIQGKYAAVQIPVLMLENDLFDDMWMTGKKLGRDFDTLEKEKFISIVNSPHPLAAGLSPGLQFVFEPAAQLNWGHPAPGAIVVATVYGEPDKPVIFAYEKGGSMDADHIAPARRVAFCLNENAFKGIRPEGVALFDAALVWSLGTPGTL